MPTSMMACVRVPTQCIVAEPLTGLPALHPVLLARCTFAFGQNFSWALVDEPEQAQLGIELTLPQIGHDILDTVFKGLLPSLWAIQAQAKPWFSFQSVPNLA